MIFRKIGPRDLWLVELEPHTDDRGQFVRTWCREEFAKHGLDVEFAQSSVSINPLKGTLRGLHWQAAPHAEVKIVRCVRGAIYDVVADVDPASATYGEWVGVVLTPQSLLALYVPEGFAHGFQTLVDDTEVHYLLSAPYSAAAGRGLRYDDPTLGIGWPLPVVRISERDKALPLLDASFVRQLAISQCAGTVSAA